MPLYCIDKPLGLSSHDVVARARRILGTRRVGHAGTLDPLATGVLLLLSQEATKLSQFVTGHDKSYLAWVTFGIGTPTLDAEGPASATADASGLEAERLIAALPAFLALSEQRPPAFSAVKQAGVRSYAAARRGDVVEPPARAAGYRAISLLALESDFAALPRRFAPAAQTGQAAAAARASAAPLPATEARGPAVSAPAAGVAGDWRPDQNGREFDLPPRLPGAGTMTALLSLTVAAGTYVRSFARDLGAALDLPAHLSGLVRTASGGIDLAHAATLETLAAAREVPLRAALDLPELVVDEATAVAITQGRRPPLEVVERTAVIDAAGGLVAVVDPDEERGFTVARVFSGGA